MRTTTLSLAATRFVVLLSCLPWIAGADDTPDAKSARSNRLARETSPYLLMHAHNPVDWYPWGPEAFAKAKAEDKPVFLSVGYSSCYWCHVMERESFLDPEIAKVLNAQFVSIKVDREERSDVDQIYMTALQAFRPGGWPMSLFLTPDGRPFFAGSYFPPRDREGVSGFLTVVTEVGKAWGAQRKAIEKTADAVADAVRRRLKAASDAPTLALAREWARAGVSELQEQFDPDHGGFGFDPVNPRRPKFPQAVDLLFLLDQVRRQTRAPGGERAAGASGGKEQTAAGEKAEQRRPATAPLEMVLLSLDRMARGGIRDHLGGGYHRYATDRFWVVPHFEKMLYDNALLATAHLFAYELTGDPRWREESEATFAFVERSMTSPDGGFYSALDAETNHEEGGYYVWARDQVVAALGHGTDTQVFLDVYALNDQPTFDNGRYVLYEPKTRAAAAKTLKTTPQELEALLAPMRARLLAAREKRPAPLCDDKILTAWNGLMIAAYAEGYRVLKSERFRRAAERGAEFILAKLRLPDGRLLRTYRAGKAKLPAYQEDYAFLAHGLLRLHDATGEPRWLREARALLDRMIVDFEDRAQGGYYFTADGHETLLARAKEPFDGALPSGNSLAIIDLLALFRLTGERSYRDHADKALQAFSSILSRSPAALPMTLVGLEQFLDAGPGLPAPKLSGLDTQAGPSKPVVTASARLAGEGSSRLAPGREFDVVITASIRDGWHIYANPAGLPELKPTTLQLDQQSDRALSLVKVSYPAGESKVLSSSGAEKVAVYEGKVQFTARLGIDETAAPGSIQLWLVLSYQACNDSVCLAPARVRLNLTMNLERAETAAGAKP
jgi:uncharacterized protein YyaL (SSP411 family)